MQHRIRDLQVLSYQMLQNMVEAFDEDLAIEEAQRALHVEYVDATEILIEDGVRRSDALNMFMIHYGVYLPDSILSFLKDASYGFQVAYYRNQSGTAAEEQNADHFALQADESLHQAVQTLREYLNDRYGFKL